MPHPPPASAREQDTPELPRSLTSVARSCWVSFKTPSAHTHPVLRATSSRSTSRNACQAPRPCTHPEGFCQGCWRAHCHVQQHKGSHIFLVSRWYSPPAEWGWRSCRWLPWVPPADGGEDVGRDSLQGGCSASPLLEGPPVGLPRPLHTPVTGIFNLAQL